MLKPDIPTTAIQTNLAAIFLSLELSRSTWLITSLSPGNGDKMSKHSVAAGSIVALIELFSKLQERSRARTGQTYPIITIQEAGLDGFWVHRSLEKQGIESHIVDAASIATPRRRRRVKTDRVDGEALLRVLLAFKRKEPRVCAMVQPISHEEEDRRRIGRERKALMVERVGHVNRMKGLLFSQGISDYEPLQKDRRQRLKELQTGDGQMLAQHMKAQIARELDRLELVMEQIKAVEDERDAPRSKAQTRPNHRRSRCYLGSKASVRSLRTSYGRKVCSGLSTTAARSLPMQDWHPRLGKAARLTANRACRKQAIRDCARL